MVGAVAPARGGLWLLGLRVKMSPSGNAGFQAPTSPVTHLPSSGSWVKLASVYFNVLDKLAETDSTGRQQELFGSSSAGACSGDVFSRS